MIPLVLALAIVSSPGAPSSPDDALRSTVTVGGMVGTTRNGEAQFGAGEIVAQRADGTLLVLTARHVVAGVATPRIFLADDAAPGTHVQRFFSPDGGRPASVVALAHDADLALLAFRPQPDDRYAVAHFGAGAPASGTIVGHPFGVAWTTSSFALVSAPQGTLIVRCTRCGPGDSGGGVFDASGNLTGIIIEQEDRLVDGREIATGNFRALALAPVRRFVASAGTSDAATAVATQAAALPAHRGLASDAAWTRFRAARPAAQGDSGQ